MNITRNNYEEFFMLYADNELSATEKTAVEAFIAANPDLRQELVLFLDFKLNPDASVVFTGKQDLLKQETTAGVISTENAASFFVLYADDELSHQQKAVVEDFVYHHPQLQADFELARQLRLSPDNSIVFEDKECLYHKEEVDKVVPFWRWRLVAAAIVLLLAGAFWLYQSKKGVQTEMVKNMQPVKRTPLPSLQNTAAVKNAGTGNSSQSVNTVAALTGIKKDSQPENHLAKVPSPVVVHKMEPRAGNEDKAPLQAPVVQEAYVADNGNDKLTGSVVSPIKETINKKVEINKEIAAAKSVPDQQVNIPDPNENNAIKAQWASSSSNDKLELLNTSVNTKNSMRGFLRKASRLIAKKTGQGEENGNRKGILIGGFEIAVR